jgi:hypothetical protein
VKHDADWSRAICNETMLENRLEKTIGVYRAQKPRRAFHDEILQVNAVNMQDDTGTMSHG